MFKNLREAKKNLSDKQFQAIHKQASASAKALQNSEVDFIRSLQDVHSNMVHRWCGFNSLHKYGIHCLQLSSSQSYMYGSLAKATKELKSLGQALDEGRINPSKAARVLSVINKDNEEEWIQKAITLPKSQLEKEVVKLNPKKVKGERSEYLTEDVIDLKTPVSESIYKQLVRVQDLMSQSEGRAVSMEEVFEGLTNSYLKKKDPLLKAERFRDRELKKQKKEVPHGPTRKSGSAKSVNDGELKSENLSVKGLRDDSSEAVLSKEIEVSFAAKNAFGLRRAIPGEVEHHVHLRDQRECQHEYPSGEKCREKRWIHLHHKLPISQGGDHRPENIITMCSAHHELVHILMKEGPNSQRYPSFAVKGRGLAPDSI